MNLIVRKMDKAVKAIPNPGVYLSGGIDSAIVLHHLRKKYDGKIHTFTAIFGNQADKISQVLKIVKHYNTVHHFVEITEYVKTLYVVMHLPFAEPRYNIWPYWLAKEAKHHCKNVYIGEGSDEVFGGYPDRTFLEGWAHQLIYVKPTFDIIHKFWNLRLHTPFRDLDTFELYEECYRPPNKMGLREAYRGLIPDFIVNAPSEAPGFTNYFDTWTRELTEYVEITDQNNPTVSEVKGALQLLATDAWCKARKVRLKNKKEENRDD